MGGVSLDRPIKAEQVAGGIAQVIIYELFLLALPVYSLLLNFLDSQFFITVISCHDGCVLCLRLYDVCLFDLLEPFGKFHGL
jgi:hypothetical protein